MEFNVPFQHRHAKSRAFRVDSRISARAEIISLIFSAHLCIIFMPDFFKINCAKGELSRILCRQNRENYSHQKSNFKARMHQTRFQLGRKGTDSAPQVPYSWILGVLLLWGGKVQRRREREGREESRAFLFHHFGMSVNFQRHNQNYKLNINTSTAIKLRSQLK